MSRPIREAGLEDTAILVALMAEFYAESDLRFDPRRAEVAFTRLLADSELGRVWLIAAGAETVGYAVLTLGYSMEYGGRDAFLDDLFIQAPFRGRGLGRRALATVRAECGKRGVRALHLEVGRDNEAAQALYRAAGFVGNERQLLTLRLAPPLHED